MKWKLGAFREPFKAHKTGDDAAELRPDMGPQRHSSSAPTAGAAVGTGGRKRGGNGRQGGGSAGTSGGRTGSPSGGVYGLGRGRRVMVKARYRTHQPIRRGGRQRVLAAHVRYLARPNATLLERDAAFFDARDEALDAAGVPTAWARDRHHWRVILSPEEGDQLDLRQFVRDFAERLERELDTPLEWVAVTHHNTDQPHAHLLIRGVRAGGRDLTLPRDVVGERLREWAEELATRQLGERSESEADAYLDRLTEARRATQLDALLLGLAMPPGDTDATPNDGHGVWHEVQVPRDWTPDLAGRHHLERRLRVLAGLEVAERTTPPFRRAKWRVRGDLIEQLDRLAERGTDQEQSLDRAATTAAVRPAEAQRGAAERPQDRRVDELGRRQSVASQRAGSRSTDVADNERGRG